jgi:hypothetical protein
MVLMKIISLLTTFALTVLLTLSNANAGRLASGYLHTLVIDENQDVIASGISRNGEIGPNAPSQTETAYGMAPIHVGIKAKSVAANMSRSAAVQLDGSVVTWGKGIGNVISFDPIEIGSFANAIDVSVEMYALYVLDEDGNVFEIN